MSWTDLFSRNCFGFIIIMNRLLKLMVLINNTQKMQVNCLIFPAPKEFKFGLTIKKILLVPREKQTKMAYYHSELLDLPDETNTDFETFMNNQHNKSMSKSSAETKIQDKSQTMIVNEEKSQKKINPRQKVAISHLLENSRSVVNQDSLPKVNHKQYIPCLFIPGRKNHKLILFFHANGQDISSAYQFINTIGNQVNLSILAMEYQGYSVYSGNANPESIIQDAIRVMEFLIEQGMNTKDIILLGRSIGGGIAFSIAAKYPTASVVLLSPFLSLKKIASDLYGSCSSAVLKETFDNEHNAKNIASPILLIHGLKDQLVPYEHSVAILGECRSYCRLNLVENMTHSKFSFRRDFTWPLKTFLHDLDIIT